jgi:hypothetical protein
MPNTQNNPNNPHQQGSPQKTQDMPSSGNSPPQTGATRGTDETTGGNRDVERSGMAGAGAQRAQDTSSTNDPGTPGKAEGNENTETKGNQ